MHFEISKTNDSIFDNTYLVQQNQISVGYISIAHHIVRGEMMATTLYYGIEAGWRKQGIGTLLIKEVSDYLLNRDDINTVIMNIDIENVYGQKVAKNAGFVYIPEFSDEDELQFRKIK